MPERLNGWQTWAGKRNKICCLHVVIINMQNVQPIYSLDETMIPPPKRGTSMRLDR